MTTISASITADSISPQGIRITTLHARYPRFIHSELMTHRVFSRNARSSRAVPVATMLKEIEDDPVIPLHWGANQKGMQADRECDAAVLFSSGEDVATRRSAWLRARDEAVRHARAFHEAGYHKQVVNRLLEPFMHIDTLITATDWANFITLRDHKDAEPHIADLARRVTEAMWQSRPSSLRPGQWHLPYDLGEETFRQVEQHATVDGTFDPKRALDLRIKLSVTRCARISYRPFDGNASIEAELARYESLVGSTPVHASPAEHQATPDVWHGYGWEYQHEHRNFRGWRQYRSMLKGETVPEQDFDRNPTPMDPLRWAS